MQAVFCCFCRLALTLRWTCVHDGRCMGSRGISIADICVDCFLNSMTIACNIHHCHYKSCYYSYCYGAVYAGVDWVLAQGQGIWGLFQLPSSRGRPEDLYSHPISESLEFSVVATSTAKQHSLSLTFRSAWHSLCTADMAKSPHNCIVCAQRHLDYADFGCVLYNLPLQQPVGDASQVQCCVRRVTD